MRLRPVQGDPKLWRSASKASISPRGRRAQCLDGGRLVGRMSVPVGGEPAPRCCCTRCLGRLIPGVTWARKASASEESFRCDLLDISALQIHSARSMWRVTTPCPTCWSFGPPLRTIAPVRRAREARRGARLREAAPICGARRAAQAGTATPQFARYPSLQEIRRRQNEQQRTQVESGPDSQAHRREAYSSAIPVFGPFRATRCAFSLKVVEGTRERHSRPMREGVCIARRKCRQRASSGHRAQDLVRRGRRGA
jgi:hypothetical protein